MKKQKFKYWDINEILRYQRIFNFINGVRSIGKSYTTQKFFIKRALQKQEEFIYLVRTQDQKKSGVFEKAFSKVLQNEYPCNTIKFTNDICYLEIPEEDDQILGYCVALTEYVKLKVKSFPNVYWLMFDEYMLEKDSPSRYVNGWKEPELFLNIYHTIDREELRVKCFLLGNNTEFYNPYHLSKAFRIPPTEVGNIWKIELVLFQWAIPSESLTEDKSKNPFLKMIERTEYGSYASKGNYIGDNHNFIMKRTTTAKHQFYFSY